jgi:hypothetical protein
MAHVVAFQKLLEDGNENLRLRGIIEIIALLKTGEDLRSVTRTITVGIDREVDREVHAEGEDVAGAGLLSPIGVKILDLVEAEVGHLQGHDRGRDHDHDHRKRRTPKDQRVVVAAIAVAVEAEKRRIQAQTTTTLEAEKRRGEAQARASVIMVYGKAPKTASEIVRKEKVGKG